MKTCLCVGRAGQGSPERLLRARQHPGPPTEGQAHGEQEDGSYLTLYTQACLLQVTKAEYVLSH